MAYPLKSGGMELINSKWLAAILGIIGGMTKYVHMLLNGQIQLLDITIQPMIMAALCGFAGVLGKQLYKWVATACRQYVAPWLKSKLKK